MNRITTLDEKTKISLFTALGAVFGGLIPLTSLVWFVVSVSFKAENANAENAKQDVKIEKVETKVDSYLQVLIEIRDRLARIEAKGK